MGGGWVVGRVVRVVILTIVAIMCVDYRGRSCTLRHLDTPTRLATDHNSASIFLG